MKLKNYVVVLLCLLAAIPVLADDDVMITRDGSMIPVRVEKISTSQVTFIDLKHKRRGRLNAPADFVYMIMKEKGNNIFFDEEGNQTTSPAIKFEKKDDVVFLNKGEMFVVYNLSVGKEKVKYQLKDKKKAPWIEIEKDQVFMIRNSDGTTTLYNNSYQEKQKQLQQQNSVTTASPVSQTAPALAATTVAATSSTSTPLLASSTPTPTVTPSAAGQNLVTTNMDNTKYTPAPDMAPTDLEMAVNAINPYTLYRKGSMAEYCFQYDGKQTQYTLGGPTYLRQIVEEEKVVDGQIVAYIRQELYNKKHEPSKNVSDKVKEMLFPTEIDTAGTYHLTHNVAKDLYKVGQSIKRQGYGILVPGSFVPGMHLQTSTIYDTSKGGGFVVKTETTYSNWQVIGEEQIQTPAGTFDCVKLTGKIKQKIGKNAKPIGESITCWIARGVGVVQYETITDGDKRNKPFVIYLNKIDLK